MSSRREDRPHRAAGFGFRGPSLAPLSPLSFESKNQGRFSCLWQQRVGLRVTHSSPLPSVRAMPTYGCRVSSGLWREGGCLTVARSGRTPPRFRLAHWRSDLACWNRRVFTSCRSRRSGGRRDCAVCGTSRGSGRPTPGHVELHGHAPVASPSYGTW